ncbi:homocitrate synthase [Mycobacterium kubicae]|uniref:homocitrate synthase n=1 Tax=Mycobacterium kubicae TaxID=120959 RepID=UPI0007FF3EB2|nr:homocitrate synthase [Mycobacterium kubicae]OBF22628.1 homocitrate synthase [Mycobacterium kubicae]OBK47918.1 homocitrate synthase [Mycobacterium kubicae]
MTTFSPAFIGNASAAETLAGSSSPSSANAWFEHRFSARLPRGLREQAEAMSWERFVTTFTPNTGPLRLGQWACIDPERPAGRLGPQARTYRAMIAVGDSISTSTAAASGPVGALTAMLHDRGILLETLRFHQIQRFADTATFIYGTNGARAEWAAGWSADPTQSALRALIACANRLMM